MHGLLHDMPYFTAQLMHSTVVYIVQHCVQLLVVCSVVLLMIVYEQHCSFVLLLIKCSVVLTFSDIAMLLVLQYMERGSLRNILNVSFSWKEFTPSLRHQILVDIAQGMQYVHDQQVFHRDLKRYITHYMIVCMHTL
jgi:serine/threonine protein kinase